MWDPRMDMPNCPPNRIAFFVKLRFSGCCLSFSWSFVVVFSHDFSIHTCSLRQAIASGEWLYTQTENVLALRLAVLPCISVCIGCGYMVVLSHNITWLPIFSGIAAVLILRRVPSWERSHIPSQPALLKMMIFLSQGGICDRFLDGTTPKVSQWYCQFSSILHQFRFRSHHESSHIRCT